MELLTPDKYRDYEEFVKNHPRGSFLQSTLWQQVKNNWGWEGVISRNEEGKIVGAMGVLVQKIPLIGTSFLYCPRGPVCDVNDKEVLKDLKKGADLLAKKHRAHIFKWDPDLLIADTAVHGVAESDMIEQLN